LHLKRFKFVEINKSVTSGYENCSLYNPPHTVIPEYVLRKNMEQVLIPDSLSLSTYIGSSQGGTATVQDEEPIYKLISVVHHIGNNASSGHYTADALRHATADICEDTSMDSDQPTWVSFDDGHTSTTSLIDVTGSQAKQETAYMLLYALDK
jgi:Ubiquitin carboxyl-terminal hydrolase